jgi:hypothetical protein
MVLGTEIWPLVFANTYFDITVLRPWTTFRWLREHCGLEGPVLRKLSLQRQYCDLVLKLPVKAAENS